MRGRPPSSSWMVRLLEATTKSDELLKFLAQQVLNSAYLCCSMVRYLESDSPV
jgi:hypothetical protein